MENFEKLSEILEEVLKENYMFFFSENIEITENNFSTNLKFDFSGNGYNSSETIFMKKTLSEQISSQSNKGLIDALHKGLIQYFKSEIFSQIKFCEFWVKAKIPDKKQIDPIQSTEKEATAQLIISNISVPYKKYTFIQKSNSIIDASFGVVLQVFEIFYNAENAYKICKECFLDAKKRNNVQVAEKYIFYMSEIMKLLGNINE